MIRNEVYETENHNRPWNSKYYSPLPFQITFRPDNIGGRNVCITRIILIIFQLRRKLFVAFWPFLSFEKPATKQDVQTTHINYLLLYFLIYHINHLIFSLYLFFLDESKKSVSVHKISIQKCHTIPLFNQATMARYHISILLFYHFVKISCNVELAGIFYLFITQKTQI